MAKQQTDEELNLKRKARRRLVGAIALTLAVVVVLPMVLDSEPKLDVQNIELRIPAPDKVGEFVPGTVTQPEMAEPPALAAPIVEPAPAVPETTVGAGSGAAQAGAIKPATPPKVPDIAKPPEAGKASGAAKQNKAAAAEAFIVQTGAYSNVNTAKQEFDKLKAWGFKAAFTEKVGDKVRVRVGPYAEREKAEKVRQLLEKHGLHPVVMGGQ